MDIFGINLEASVKLLDYTDNEEVFSYKDIDNLVAEDGKIRFDAFIEVKQDREAPERAIDVTLVHIKEEKTPESGEKRQKLSEFRLGKINLSGLDSSKGQSFPATKRLHKDIWKIKQYIRWSFAGVPTNGTGTYALLLSVTDENGDWQLLDCDYTEVES